MRRFLALGYGVVVYGLFGLVFAYFVGFVGGVLVPKTVDDGDVTSTAVALAIDLGLLAAFFAHHSIFARPNVKRAIAGIVPPAIERSTYVLVATLLLGLVMAAWHPLPQIIWQTTGAAAIAIRVVFWVGVAIALVASHTLDGLELFGVRQVIAFFHRTTRKDTPFRTPGLYRFVRHPLMTGLLIGVWAAPTMTAGHLVFTLAMTTYILAAVKFLEERDLRNTFGADYERYQREVPMLVPGIVARGNLAQRDQRPGRIERA